MTGIMQIIAAATSYVKGIFGFGYNSGYLSVSNLVSNTGTLASNTTGVGTARSELVAAGFGSGRAIFGLGWVGYAVGMTNLVSNTGVVGSDVTEIVNAARSGAAAASYGSDKAIFLYGFSYSAGTYTPVNSYNLISNTGVVGSTTTGPGYARYYLTGAGYGLDKAIFAYGSSSTTQPYAASSYVTLVSNTGTVAAGTTTVGTPRFYLTACTYGADKAIILYGLSATSTYSLITNLVSDTGVVASDTAQTGSGRQAQAASGYGQGTAIMAYGTTGSTPTYTNLINYISNTGVVSADQTYTSGGTLRATPAGSTYG